MRIRKEEGLGPVRQVHRSKKTERGVVVIAAASGPDGDSGQPVSYDEILAATKPGPLHSHLAGASATRGLHLSSAVTNAPWLLLAVDECLLTIEWFCRAFEVDDAVRDLLGQASAAILEGAEAVLTKGLAGMNSPGRKLIEIEFLFRDFALDGRRAEDWSKADRSGRVKRFSFAAVRGRVEAAANVPKGSMLPDRAEFAAHSEGIHVTPIRAKNAPGPAAEVVLGFCDLLEHSRRLLGALYALAAAAAYELSAAADDPPAMPALQKALAQMGAIAVANGMPPRELIAEDWEEHLAAALRAHPLGRSAE